MSKEKNKVVSLIDQATEQVVRAATAKRDEKEKSKDKSEDDDKK